MVAVVAGNGLGLFNSSLNILGAAAGSFGQGTLGQAGGQSWVNASTGNLILRFTDEQLSGVGQDLFHTRTYNALGALNDADGDGWRWDGERRLVLSGTRLASGSSLTRTTGDGHETVYAWTGTRYQSTEGDGAHDFIEWDAQNAQWYWTDGSTRSVERYDGNSGLLVSVRDTQGTLITYGYHSGRLTSVSDSSGQALLMVYNEAGKLTRLDTRSSATGPLTSQVYYEYDSFGRLTQVSTDLTPADNSIADGQYYYTRYTYDGSSFRIASVSQSDGTAVNFTYELVGGEYRVKTVTDASGTTTFTYDLTQRFTKVHNALNQEWTYFYDVQGQLTYVRTPKENGQYIYTGYQYDADGNLTRITDNSGDAVSYFYDDRGNRILERDPQGVTVARTFSASNQVLSEIHYSQPATWYTASGAWGEPPASSAQVTRYVYDFADRLRFVVSATGSVGEYRYNANGLRVREIVYGDGRYNLGGLAADAAIAESTLVNWVAGRDKTRSQVTTLDYDYRGNVNQRVVYANVLASGEPVLDTGASVTAYVYNEHGQLLQTLALRGANRPELSSTAYDGMGRVIAQMDASGTRTTVYDGQARKIAVTTASGLLLTQVYDPLGRLIRIEEAVAGGAWRGNTYYAYDAAGRLSMKEDPTGVRTYTFYDDLGRVAAEVDGTGRITRYSYNQRSQRVSTLGYATQVDTSSWFNNGAVTVTLAQILPASTTADRLTRLNYDNAGRLLNSVDAAGIVTQYEYDGRSQLVRQQVGARVTRFFFDADGRQVAQLDAEGYLRENVYNAAGQLQQAIRYSVATTLGARDTGSLADLRPNGASLSTWNFYDGAGRQIGSVDEQGFVSETVYNESANTATSIRYATAYTAALSAASSFATVRDAVKNGASQVLVTAYDGQGRVLSRTATDGSVTTFEYDAAGRLVRETSAAGTAEERSVRTLYDAFGQTTGKLLGEASARITAGMTQAQVAAVYSQYGTTWSYDAAGRVVSVTDALGNRTLSFYDAAGRLTRVINAVGEVSETKYNAFGDVVEKSQLSKRLDTVNLNQLDTLLAAIRNASNDSRTTYAYDTRGLLLTSIDAEGISTTNQYDQYGQLQRQIRVIAGSRTVTSAFGYNLRGERTSQTRDAGGLNLTDSTVYDAFGRAIRSTDAAGNLSTSEYLDNGRTVVVRDPLNHSRRTELDAFGRTLKDVDALGNVTSYSYDDVNRSVVVTMPDGTQVSTWKNRHGDTLKVINAKGDATQYDYNREGQLTQTIDALGQVVEAKRYDKAGRLSESVDARGVVTHLDYDAASRVVQRSVDPSGLNQRTTYEFDTSGRQIRVVDAAGTNSARVTENRYDRKGQLVQTIVDPNGLQLSTRYSYDGLGNVLRTSQGSVASPEQRVTDYVFNAVGQRRFSIDALGYVSERSYDAAGNVIQETRYANKYAGSRDAATLQQLGNNLLNNAAFANPGSNGLPAGWNVSSLPAGITITANPGNSQTYTAQDLPPGDSVVQVFQDGRVGTGGEQEVFQQTLSVSAGQRYAFSVYTAAINTNIEVFIAWLDASGRWFSNTDVAQNLDQVHGGTRLADYKRLEAIGVAPEGAVGARVVIRKSDTLAGHSNSQALLAHPQFEILEAGETASSAWTRPLISTRGDDRVTQYVYDAKGRQRFSVDALGYVSERSYDAAGNLVQETRYANKYTGSRDMATLQQLRKNLLDNVAFGNPGSNGVPAGWNVFNLPAGTTITANPANAPAYTAQDLPAGDSVVQVYQDGRIGSGGDQEVFQQTLSVNAGQRYAFSVYTAAINTNIEVYIAWLDANGTWFSNTTVAQNLDQVHGGTRLADYKRLEAIGVAPEGAVGARVVIRKSDTLVGHTNSLALLAHPQFEALDATQTASSAWTRPLISTSADDRITSYVYDTQGRQRFSVDALGYVSERRYDAAGNVIQETRYANKLSGPRNAVTLQNLRNQPPSSNAADRVSNYVYDALGRQRFSVDALGYISERSYDAADNVIQETRYANKYTGSRDAAALQQLGNNLLNNAAFANPGSNGLPAGWNVYNLPAGTTITVNPSNSQTYTAQDLPAGDSVVQVFQNGRIGTGGEQEVFQQTLSVSAGQRYAFSVYTAAINTNIEVFIAWLDASGRWFSNTDVAQNLDQVHGGTRLADYKRLEAIGVAPEGAVGARVVIRKSDTLAGHTNSQALLAHPQFEVLDPGETASSAWTRPLISASADDRVTNYVYDALGRQRFSVDALGYVSERVYDAAGNVTRETRYANKYAGSRDATTLQKLGINLLNNVAFANPGSNGLPAGWTASNLPPGTTITVNPANSSNITAQDLPAGDGVVQIYQNGREGTGSYHEVYQHTSTVSAGQRYAFSVYTATVNADVELYIAWLDASGRWFDNTTATSASQNYDEVGGGASLTNYKRLEVMGQAPEGAVRAFVAIRKYDTKAGQTSSQVLLAHPQFEALAPGQTTSSAWTRPLVTASAEDRVTNYVYDALGRQRFSIDALGYVSERSYDAAGNLTEETRYANALSGPRDAATLRKLETGNLKQSLSSTADRVTRSSYDTTGQLSSVTDALGYTESYTYDAFGNRTSLTNKNGQTWTYRYDQTGQLLEEITPPVWVSNTTLGGAASGKSAYLVTRYEYDGFGQVVSRSEGRLRDAASNDPARDDLSQVRTTTYGYDGLGHQVRITSPGWYNKTTGQYQQNSDGTANTFQVTTEVTYDGLGNAVRNRVQANNTGVAGNDYVDSYKAYDLLGQVRYEVDALKGVTSYEYDSWGSVTLTRRHATAFNGSVPPKGYFQPGDFTAATAPVDINNDRSIINRYDRLGRKTEVQQDIVSLYNFTGNVATSSLKNVAPTKLYGYDAFGQVIRETLVARDITGASVMSEVSAVNYYDRLGQRIGSVDALGYYTRAEYDANGKVIRQVEYANALVNWNEAGVPTAQASTKDRSLRFSYDGADRLIQTTQENVTYWQQTFAAGAAKATTTQVTGDVTVSRSTYDGVGNVRTLTDAAGNVTTTEYNALGHVVKVTEPARYSARAGAANPFESAVYASPTITYAVNAFGQVVQEAREAGLGQAGLKQVSTTVYDAAGHVARETDAAGSAQNFKVDAAGHRLEETREITTNLTGWRYNNHTLRRTFTYDALGQQLSTADWYSDNGVQKSTTNSVTYNRFGEITSELLNGNLKAGYRYNQIGQAIEQRNGQGVTQIDYDLSGKASRSAQLGDLTTSADDRITYIRNDLLGRVVEQHLPAFEANINADTLNNVNLTLVTPIVRQTSDRWGNVLSRTDARGYITTYSYDHNNQVLAETLPETDILRENGTSYRASLIHEKRYDALGQLIEEADLIAPGSTPLRTRQHVYNQAGELVRDIDALGASRYYIADAHGNRVGTLDPMGIATVDEYDVMDRHIKHGIVRDGQRVILQTNQYDQAGRLYAEINGTATVQETLISTAQTNYLSILTGVAGNTRFSVFDERGNIVQSRNESGVQKTFLFNRDNRKVEEIDGLGNSLTWTYNEGSFGQLTAHKDLYNRNFSYIYDSFGQLVSENSDKSYTYYFNGLLRSVTLTSGAQNSYRRDGYNIYEVWQGATTSAYTYDLLGNRVGEVLSSAHSWYTKVNSSNAGSSTAKQETRFKFDETGRMAGSRALAGTVAMGTGTFTYYTTPPRGNGEGGGSFNDFSYPVSDTVAVSLSYQFDEYGNRRRVILDSTGPNWTPTVIDNWFKYDANDRAVVVDGFLYNGTVVAGKKAALAKGYTLSYDAAGRRISSEQWSGKDGAQGAYQRSEYIYNDFNQVITRNVRQIIRQADATSNGAIQSIGTAQTDLSNQYDERGRIVVQRTFNDGKGQSTQFYTYRGDNQRIAEVSYTYYNNKEILSQVSYFGEADMIDATGNQIEYRYAVYNLNGVTSQTGRYKTKYARFESYKPETLTLSTDGGGTPGTTTYTYSERGDLLQLYDGSKVFRRFASNGDGLMIGRRESNDTTQNYLYYQNAALANGGGVSMPAITDTLTAISGEYPGLAPSSYLVNQGDTLEKIAQAVWGDSRMWYLIADANGIEAGRELTAGSSLRIPNVVSSNHNTATTFKPYDPTEVIGNTITAPTPPKPKKKKCNAVASIVMVVVAVVVNYFVPGLGGVFLGSLASQTAGKAMGVVDHISLKQAVVTTFTAGVVSMAAPMISGTTSAIANETVRTTINYAAQGAVIYASNYVASKVVGLENSFSWKNMVASAIGSAIAGNLYSDDGFMGSVIRGEVSAHASAWMKDKWFGGGRPDYGQVAVDAFGNALADYVVSSLQKAEKLGTQRQSDETRGQSDEIRRGSDEWRRSTETERLQRFNDKRHGLASDGDVPFMIEITAEAPDLLERAMSYMEDARAIDQAYLTSVVDSSTGVFSESVGRARRAITGAGYDVVDAVLGMAHLATSSRARAELAHNLSSLAGDVMENPGQAFSAATGATSNYLATTGPAQMAEDTLRLGLGAFAGGAGLKAGSLAGKAALNATTDVVGSAVRTGVNYARHSVYVPPPSGTLNGGIFISSLGKRITTVTKAMSKSFQGKDYLDPFTNKMVAPKAGEVLAVDHIYPVSKIINLPGFKVLTRSQMTDIIQDRIGLGNLQALPQHLNASKGASIEWRKIGDQMLDDDYIDALMDTQAVMRSKIIQQIQIFEKLNAGKL